MGAAVISELEARQLVYVNRKIGRMSSIGHSKYAVAVELRGHMKRVVGRVPRRVVRSDGGEADFRIGDRVMAVIRWGRLHRGIFAGCVSWMGAAVVISELEIIRMSMGWVLRLLLSDVVFIFGIGIRLIAVIRWGRLHRGIFAGCVSWMGAAVVISELEIVRMSMCRVLRLLLSDVFFILGIGIRVMAVIRWGRLHRGIFAGCVSWMGAAVVISELEIIRMRMGRVLRLLLGDVADFRIGVRVMAKVCFER